MLAPGGLFAFTLETHDGDGVIIGGGLRYAHAAAYVRAAIESAGLDIVAAGSIAPPATRTALRCRAWSWSPRKLESRRYALAE